MVRQDGGSWCFQHTPGPSVAVMKAVAEQMATEYHQHRTVRDAYERVLAASTGSLRDFQKAVAEYSALVHAARDAG